MNIKNQYLISKEKRYNHLEIPIIAITGGIACGKSTICDLLMTKGHGVLKADKIVKRIYAQDETKKFIAGIDQRFVKNDQIDFTALRSAFFSQEKLKSKVENFIYDKMPKVFQESLHALPKPKYLFYEIPLLFEKCLESQFDLIICVFCSPEVQLERLSGRDSAHSKDDHLKTISAQLDQEIKKRKSHFLINNNEDLDQTEKLNDFFQTFFTHPE
jgi:dephospho-CoA kinase